MSILSVRVCVCVCVCVGTYLVETSLDQIGIPETNHVPREHGVAANLMLLFMVRRSLVPALTPSLR